MELCLKSVPEPHAEPRVIVCCRLEYFNVVGCMQESATSELAVARPTNSNEQPVPVNLDRQRNRIRCTGALKAAQQLANVRCVHTFLVVERGALIWFAVSLPSFQNEDFAQARALLQNATAEIRNSTSGGDEYCQSLLADIEVASAITSLLCVFLYVYSRLSLRTNRQPN